MGIHREREREFILGSSHIVAIPVIYIINKNKRNKRNTTACGTSCFLYILLDPTASVYKQLSSHSERSLRWP
jgi:hypothetical protein